MVYAGLPGWPACQTSHRRVCWGSAVLHKNTLGKVQSRDSGLIWEFPKIRGTSFWGPYIRILLFRFAKLGSPIFGHSHMALGWALGFYVG